MDGDKVPEAETHNSSTFIDNLGNISQFVNRDDVLRMINIQEATIDRLECTNKSLLNCHAMAQNKLATTTRLYKRTAKQIADSKKDLDAIYKKILDLKSKIKAERRDTVGTKQPSLDKAQNSENNTDTAETSEQQTADKH